MYINPTDHKNTTQKEFVTVNVYMHECLRMSYN